MVLKRVVRFKMTNKKILAVPTNIITGFLGVGKTSAILHLLKQKPDNERWAVLVNEFGEIGVDGSLISGQINHSQSIYIREVPGGCMCCASGLPMQIALNQLLSEARPDRLLIEPTGLGHPIEVLQVLSNQYYQEVLSLEQTITLVDARQLKNNQYTEHQVFNQQLQIADIVIGSKLDLYSDTDKQALINYIANQPVTSQSIAPKSIRFIEHGQLPLEILSGASKFKQSSITEHHKHSHTERTASSVQSEPLPTSGFIKAVNQGEGFQSIGWRFAPNKVFDRAKLHRFLTDLKVTRVKAVFITTGGVYGYNTVNDGIAEIELDECSESRIEIICSQVNMDWEQTLLSSLVNSNIDKG